MYLFPKVIPLPFSRLDGDLKASGAGSVWAGRLPPTGQADWLPPASWLAAALTGLPGLAFLSNAQVHRDALETISLDTINDRVLNLKCSRRFQFRLGHHKMHRFIYNKN